MLEVVQDVWRYVIQMIPLGLIALAVLLLLRPARKKRLGGSGLVSSLWRETALVLFVMFCAGLAALTLFPADFWSAPAYSLLHPNTWGTLLREWDPLSYYPTWEETASQFAYLPNMLTPFEEISRALDRKAIGCCSCCWAMWPCSCPSAFFPLCCGGGGGGGSPCWWDPLPHPLSNLSSFSSAAAPISTM